MIHLLLKTTKFIPNEFHDSFFDIDFNELYKKGYRTILSDLDNTLISYEEEKPTEKILLKFKELQTIGFEVILISNNVNDRVQTFIENTDIRGFASARKPLLIGIKKALNSSTLHDKETTLIIGDQIMTDIWAANRFKVYSILVNPVKKKTEKWYTKFNRRIENNILKKMHKKYPEKWEKLDLDSRK